MKIKVGWLDILFGLRGRAMACPIARAIKRETAATYVSVHGETAYVDKLVYKIPDAGQKFITDFDFAGRFAVKPIELMLEERL